MCLELVNKRRHWLGSIFDEYVVCLSELQLPNSGLGIQRGLGMTCMIIS